MSTGGARRGRRDNGLVAAEYAVVGDVDPRIGEHLLDVLALSGIAAYLQPAADLHPITRTSTLPSRPTDRLYADRSRLEIARGYFTKVATDDDTPAVPEPDAERASTDATAGEGTAASMGRDGTDGSVVQPTATDIDAAWADIVARFGRSVDPTVTPWPASEDLSEPDADSPRPVVIHGAEEGPGDQPSLLDALDTFGGFGPETAEDDEGYLPPPPPPLPRISSAAIAGLLAIAAGVVLLFWPSLLPTGANVTMLLAFIALLGGFVTLIWRLRPGDDDFDDSDDGARV